MKRHLEIETDGVFDMKRQVRPTCIANMYTIGFFNILASLLLCCVGHTKNLGWTIIVIDTLLLSKKLGIDDHHGSSTFLYSSWHSV